MILNLRVEPLNPCFRSRTPRNRVCELGETNSTKLLVLLRSDSYRSEGGLKAMQKDGVIIEACSACASSYGVDDDLEELGFDVKGMRTYLTDYLKSDAKVLTF